MQFDRHEKHVLNTLEIKYEVSTARKLRHAQELREVSIAYHKTKKSTVAFIIGYSGTASDWYSIGEAKLNVTEPKDQGRIGRMVAFARAVLSLHEDLTSTKIELTGAQLEAMARGVDC